MPKSAKPPTSRDTRRRFEQWVKNPSCEANTLSALLGLPMAEVAKAEGLAPSTGQSPMALIRGEQFEAQLLRDDAARLRGELEEKSVLPKDSAGLLDLRMRRHGGPMANLDDARAATTSFLQGLAHARSAADLGASLVAGATISVPGGAMLPEAILVIDLLAVSYNTIGRRAELVIGEVKVYPDRGGDTDRTELASARAQAGIYLHGMRAVLLELGISSSIGVANKGFLVLTKPGSNRPSVRADEDLEFQARRAERGLAQLRQVAAKMEAAHGPNPANRLPVVRDAETSWIETCPSFCDRAQGCRSRAMACGDPAALGDDVARFVGPINLNRVRELIEGRAPASAVEQQLVARYEAANAAKGVR